ncbi:uncharacterized protein BDCG_03838 [Blastomyces dermatitidis ER-3]|uniref:C6 transcription factor n=1 Tax=Ajellomyces dermatitidis (strain ER-3 / ATCC MYA-2586) TaxID=559297 RepID=A0ABP2EX76_AJEDR|nr:uncharacterized protein BDCG_03838 [Blastomyces dermatitidis ER-3]EEQ88718.2 hypothetical protein BDCG_03838 [Blastomyces dermatitidis ER-3]EQL38841.1 hypothetical protein BDFG_00366 [Blastomyces dermatitidis ATCC 26199]
MAKTGNAAPQDVAAHGVSPSRDAAIGPSQNEQAISSRQHPNGDIIHSLDMSAIRAMPTVYFIRTIYMAIMLIKLHFAAIEQKQTDDTKQHADCNLQVSEWLEALIQMFAGWGELWPAARLTMVFKKLKTCQLQAITPTTPETSSPNSFPATAGNSVPSVLPDFSSVPLISMDLDLDQMFPDAMQGFDLDFDDLSNNALGSPPDKGLAVGGSAGNEALKTDICPRNGQLYSRVSHLLSSMLVLK